MHPFRVIACLFAASLALSVGPVHAHQGRVLPASLASPLAPLLNSLARLSTGWEGVAGEFAVSRSVATTLEVRFSWHASALPARDDQRVCLSAQLKVPNDTGAVVRPFVVTSAKPSAPLPGAPGRSGRGKPGT